MKTVSNVIVSYNNLRDVREVLGSIERHLDTESIEVILVDNASEEPVVETVRREYPSVRLLPQSENTGFGRGCNTGARAATGEYLLFVNSDIVFRGNPVPAMIGRFLDDTAMGEVGVTLRNADGSMQPSGFRFPALWLRLLQLSGVKYLLQLLAGTAGGRFSGGAPDFVSGAFCMIPRSLFEAVGGFDERYFMYVEDADLGYKVHTHGKKASLVETADIIHLGRHYEVPDIPFVFYQMNVGLLLFYRLHYGKYHTLMLSLLSILFFSARWALSSLSPGGAQRRRVFASVLRVYVNDLRGRSDRNPLESHGKGVAGS